MSDQETDRSGGPNAVSKTARTDADDDGSGPPAGSQERGRLYRRLHANPALALTTKVVVAVAGTAVFLAGVVMIVTPGPAFVLIPLGLAILATEFAWARTALEKAREQARKAKERSDAVDPRVRRRRMLLTALAVVVVVGAVVAYVAAYDWPAFAVSAWDVVQGFAGWVPELPKM